MCLYLEFVSQYAIRYINLQYYLKCRFLVQLQYWALLSLDYVW